MKRKTVIALASLIVCGTLLGASTNLAKVAGSLRLPPLAFLTWSILGAAMTLTVIALLRRDLPAVNRRTLEYFAVAALVSVAGSNLIFFSAVPVVGAGFVALIITLPPLLTYAGALVLGLERFALVRALGVLFALAGAVVLASRQLSAPDAPVAWILIALCGPVLLAIGNIYRSVRWPPGESADALAPGMLIAATLMLMLAAIVPGLSLRVPPESGWNVYGLIVLQAAVFAGQFQLLFVLQKAGGPVLLSLLGAVGAITGVPVAVFLLGETVPGGLLVGSVLIGLGIWCLSRPAPKTAEAAT